MAVKTITITEEAYRHLAGLKREGESFSEVINRLAGRHPLGDLVGALSPGQGRTLEKAVKATRKDWKAEVARRAKRMRP